MAKKIIETTGVKPDTVKLDPWQNIKTIHWPDNDYLVITARYDETYAPGTNIEYWIWSDSFGAASLEDNMIHDFVTGDPRGGLYLFPTNNGHDLAAATETMDAFASTSEGPHMHLEGRTEVFGTPNPFPPNSVGMNIEITASSVPLFKGTTFTEQSYLLSVSEPLGTSYPPSVPPTPIPWGDVLKMKKGKYQNWKSDEIRDDIHPPTDYVDDAQGVAVFNLKEYKTAITLGITMSASISPGEETSGTVTFALGAYIMRGLEKITIAKAGPASFVFPKETVSFGLKYADLPTSFLKASPVRQSKKVTTGSIALNAATHFVQRTSALIADPKTKKIMAFSSPS